MNDLEIHGFEEEFKEEDDPVAQCRDSKGGGRRGGPAERDSLGARKRESADPLTLEEFAQLKRKQRAQVEKERHQNSQEHDS